MPRRVGFGTFAALPEEQISEKISRRILSGDQGMIVWWSIGAGVHVEAHSHANEQNWCSTAIACPTRSSTSSSVRCGGGAWRRTLGSGLIGETRSMREFSRNANQAT
jgi:hypothetical protein